MSVSSQDYTTPGFPTRRPRRLRRSQTLRDMLADVRLDVRDLVAPLFVRDGEGVRTEIPSMPGQFQHSPEAALETVKRWASKSIPAVLLFGVVDEKDDIGSPAWSEQGPVQQLTAMIKHAAPEMLVITDVCLCEYTAHGHCGALTETGDVDNDTTLQLLSRVAISHARAGADIVAPSAMMDGQVGAIRGALDDAGFSRTGILSYAVKYASSFYGPFRDAAGSAPQSGDRRAYQMDFRDARQANTEADMDIAEGADMVMVKPAGPYMDILTRLRQTVDVPIAAYQVSGEYAALKAADANGWLDAAATAVESCTALRRAGADIVITYFAETLADVL